MKSGNELLQLISVMKNNLDGRIRKYNSCETSRPPMENKIINPKDHHNAGL